MRLDEDAVQLLRAMHRGSAVRLADEDRLQWRIDPHPTTHQSAAAANPVTLMSLSVSTLLYSTERTDGPQDLTYPNDPRWLGLGAGVLLIRLDWRRAEASTFSDRAGRIADRIAHRRPPSRRCAILGPYLRPPIELPPFQAIAADQRLVIFPSAGEGRT